MRKKNKVGDFQRKHLFKFPVNIYIYIFFLFLEPKERFYGHPALRIKCQFGYKSSLLPPWASVFLLGVKFLQEGSPEPGYKRS